MVPNLPALPDSTLVQSGTTTRGTRFEVYRVSNVTGEAAKVLIVASDGITRRDVTNEVMAVGEEVQAATITAFTTVRCLFESFKDLYPKQQAPLPPRPHFDHKRFAQRRGFAQMARVPCYRGVRVR